MAQEFLAVLGQGQAPGGAVEQRAADLFLQAADLMADRRLGEMQPCRRLGEALGFLDGDEGAQQGGVEIHGGRLINFID